MAQYKVPQNVEAEDKLLGPLSFRQFIYALIALIAGALAYFLGSMIAIPLAIIPVPIFLLFLVLALPLRKDQPMETYLAAMVRFWFKPHARLWEADSEDSMIEISSPINDDEPATKDFSGDEASRRLSFLTEISDTRGWSTRKMSGAPQINSNLNEDFVAANANVVDVFEEGQLGQNLDKKLREAELEARQDIARRIEQKGAMSVPQITHNPSADAFLSPQPKIDFQAAMNAGASQSNAVPAVPLVSPPLAPTLTSPSQDVVPQVAEPVVASPESAVNFESAPQPSDQPAGEDAPAIANESQPSSETSVADSTDEAPQSDPDESGGIEIHNPGEDMTIDHDLNSDEEVEIELH